MLNTHVQELGNSKSERNKSRFYYKHNVRERVAHFINKNLNKVK